MSEDEKEYQINVSGKAVFKAVKNLLSNDGEFKSAVDKHIKDAIHDSNLIQKKIAEAIFKVIEENDVLEAAINKLVLESIEKNLPTIMKHRLDSVMKRSLLDMYDKIMKKV